jgi:hypothetical protein
MVEITFDYAIITASYKRLISMATSRTKRANVKSCRWCISKRTGKNGLQTHEIVSVLCFKLNFEVVRRGDSTKRISKVSLDMSAFIPHTKETRSVTKQKSIHHNFKVNKFHCHCSLKIGGLSSISIRQK